ncbi:hypothetical protein FXE63_09425 [Vibrio mimicus]|uniref:hypothetical protein n=1 Tax=Vibrio mimicus TaxID=674 RepID=UPI0011DB3FE1|nr:hypothetical protein [Vibrio mimicus]TXZ07949.1 hypothetical protein FXE63_09425 [Vibrio mimicus]
MKSRDKWLLAISALLMGFILNACTEETTTTVHAKPKRGVHLVNDSPGFSFTDEAGKYYYHDTLSQYVKYDPNTSNHTWRFFSGENYSDANQRFKDHSGSYEEIKKIYDPATVQNTIPLCTQSPLMKAIKPKGTGYDYINYCGLMDVWVDPDSGNWYGLIHDEIFGINPRYDAIELAKSSDKGANWDIVGVLQTSPYGMKDIRDTPLGKTYDYGGGDPRLYVDYSTGYFYVFYTSRVMNIDLKAAEQPTQAQVSLSGFSSFMQEHVMRAPIKDKMSPDSWQKYYQGQWVAFTSNGGSLGNSGYASNLVPTDVDARGFFPVEYSPDQAETAEELVAQGKLINSPLRVINVAWNSYLEKYIATPETSSGPGNSKPDVFTIYATDSLSSQKWSKLATLDSYVTRSWYRFMMDPKVESSSNSIIGKTFRSFCYIECSDNAGGEYIDITFEQSKAKTTKEEYRHVTNGNSEYLTVDENNGLVVVADEASASEGKWAVTHTGEGYVRLSVMDHQDIKKPLYLGIQPDDTTLIDAYRKWGAEVALTDDICSQQPESLSCLSTQWAKMEIKKPTEGNLEQKTGRFRLVNRLSGLALSFSTDKNISESVAQGPQRNWNCSDNHCIDPRTVESQTLLLN